MWHNFDKRLNIWKFDNESLKKIWRRMLLARWFRALIIS